jgi:glycosyltransferase involved in cell wall biosynthesis
VDAVKIHVLMRRSQIGIDPLPDRYDFLASVNNKAVEYLSASLPIASSPRRGVLFELLAREQCGVSYDSGDAQGLANLLTDLAGRREMRNRMAANAGRLFRQHFMADKICSEMTEFLQKVVSVYRPEVVKPVIPALQARA